MTQMHFFAMSDLHTSGKTGRIVRALRACRTGQFVLLAGDIVNGGTPAQFAKLKKLIEETIPDVPVFAVSGNHDYPTKPIPVILAEGMDYPAFQQWLHERAKSLGVSVAEDHSGAYAVNYGDVSVIGLNAVFHWRKFVFPGKKQLEWFAKYLKESSAKRHIVLCHPPLASHHGNGKSGESRIYLEEDACLQRLLDQQENVMVLSGHTHISPYLPEGKPEVDELHHNLYVNCGSVCPPDLKGRKTEFPTECADGNVLEIRLGEAGTEVVVHLLHQKEDRNP